MTALANPASWLTGYMADLPTPFDGDGELDLDAFAALCERQIDAGASAIIVGETAGEASTLTMAEKDRLVRCAVETTQGRARVIAGAGSNSTDRAIELTMRAERAGADAVLSVVPYYNKPMQEGIAAHFRAIAASTALPVILHDIPARTARELSDATLIKLAESAQFVGLRDGAADVARPLRLQQRLSPHFRLLSGDDATAPAYMMAGGHGCMSAWRMSFRGCARRSMLDLSEGRLQSARLLSSRLSPIAELTGCRSSGRAEICARTAWPDAARYASAAGAIGRCGQAPGRGRGRPPLRRRPGQPSPCLARHAGPGPRM